MFFFLSVNLLFQVTKMKRWYLHDNHNHTKPCSSKSELT